MKYCGFDSGKKSSQICIVNAKREVVEEKKIAMSEGALRRAFKDRKRMRVVIEASTKSFWVADILEDCGHQVIVVDPRRTKAIGSSLIKHDKLDARVLATLCAADVLAPVHRPSERERYDRMPIVVRDALVRTRTKLINTVRCLLDSEGIVVPACGTSKFVIMTRELPDGLPEAIACAIEPALSTIESLNEAIDETDEAVKVIAESNVDMKRLQTVDGVGPIVAASFVNAIGDPARFRTGRKVGAYLGLVPSLYQSGATDRKGKITKQGNRQTRFALTMAAHAMLRAKRSSRLKAWGLAIAEKHGRRKATIALARKLASVLWAMWKRKSDFKPMMGTA